MYACLGKAGRGPGTENPVLKTLLGCCFSFEKAPTSSCLRATVKHPPSSAYTNVHIITYPPRRTANFPLRLGRAHARIEISHEVAPHSPSAPTNTPRLGR